MQPVNERLDIVQHLVENETFKDEISALIRQVGDLERLISKVAVSRINPREVVQLKRALFAIEPLKEICDNSGCIPLVKLAEQLNPCKLIADKIDKELNNDPPVQINKGMSIASGESPKNLMNCGRFCTTGRIIWKICRQRESERTGITSLKVSFNNVFGYYIEVRNTHKDKVPPEWIRKQTLVSAERYITEELKEYESKILGAEEKIISLETKLFNDLVLAILEYIPPIQLNSSLIAGSIVFSRLPLSLPKTIMYGLF